MMKKDIHEFSDTLQLGANTLAGATVKQAHHIQHLIAPVPDTATSVEQQESKVKIRLSGYFADNILLTFVDLVY